MIKVFIANHPTEAHLIAGLLKSRGIGSHVQGEALFAARGEVPVTPSTLPSVWVDDEGQAQEALAIINEMQPAPVTGLERPWRCVRCGEMVDGQFTACWNCQSPQPGGEGVE